jgi:hypothetical protein
MPAQSGSITAPASFATTADVTLNYRPDVWVLKAVSGTTDISFDGVNVHLTLTSTDVILPIPVCFTKLWARQNGGASTLRWSALSEA